MRTSRHSAGRSQRHQRGMAVIVAMLVVAIVAVIAAGLVLRQSTALRTLRGEQLRAQVGLAVDAALERAALQLREDAAQQVSTTTGAPWARPVALQSPLPVHLQLHDAQAVFNLRNLVDNGQADPHAQAVFERLCSAQGLAAATCAQLRAAVTARLAAGGALPRDTQALLMLASPQGDPAGLQALSRVTTVLPVRTLLNSNTSTAALLAAELPEIDAARLQAMLSERDAGRPLLNRGDIAWRLELTPVQSVEMQLGIHSEWFLADGSVQADAVQVPFQVLIWREHRDLGVRVQRMWTRIGT